MIQVDSLLAIFMVEGLVALLLLTIGVGIFMLKRRTRERDAARKLISKLRSNQSGRAEDLSARLSETCELDEDQIEDTLSEIGDQEKVLYQKIVKMFLSRDAALLAEIDQSVQGLSEPFCKLIEELSSVKKEDPEMAAVIAAGEAEIERLKGESERLSHQLNMAMQTMDEVSGEYTKIFGSSKDSKELDMSRKRMLNSFKNAELKLRDSFSPDEEPESKVAEA